MTEQDKIDEQQTAAIARAFRSHKKDAQIRGIRQNYKGTGSKRAHRQLFVRFENGSCIDVWLHPKYAKYGGVIGVDITPVGMVYEDRTPAQIGAQIAEHLKAWQVAEANKVL